MVKSESGRAMKCKIDKMENSRNGNVKNCENKKFTLNDIVLIGLISCTFEEASMKSEHFWLRYHHLKKKIKKICPKKN